MSQIPPTLPFRVAAAYGVPSPLPGVAPTTERAARASGLVAARVADSAELDAAHLAAGTRSAGSAGSLSLYRNPAEKNAAATGVAQGKLIDVEG